jgi:hypothetical protein
MASHDPIFLDESRRPEIRRRHKTGSVHDFRRHLGTELNSLKARFADIYQRIYDKLPPPMIFLEYEYVERTLLDVLLTGPSREARIAVAQLLQRLRPPSRRETLKALVAAAQDPEPEIRRAALACLASAELGGMSEALPVLLAAMEDDSPEARRHAIQALEGLGPDLASGAVPALAEALKDPDENVRRDSLATLAWLGSEAERAIHVIIEVLSQGSDEPFRDAAVRALLAIDREHRFALPRLEAVQGHAHRMAIMTSLRRVGHDARSLRRALESRWDPYRPDGPEAPNWFWYGGERFEIPPTPCKLLLPLWGQDSVPIKEVGQQVWETDTPSKNQVQMALKEINEVLGAAGVRWTYGKKGDFIQKL